MIASFEIPDTIWAERVNLVGDFNNWDCASLPFRRGRDGIWRVDVELDPGCEYRFRYLLDGADWRYDWHADSYAPNSDGGFDSIIVADLECTVQSAAVLHD
jgi:1,4-alpha-glucan branching enzyme